MILDSAEFISKAYLIQVIIWKLMDELDLTEYLLVFGIVRADNKHTNMHCQVLEGSNSDPVIKANKCLPHITAS